MSLSENTATVGTLSGPRTSAPFTPPRRKVPAKVIRVLVLDDNEDDFAFVKILLNKSLAFAYQLTWAPTEKAALEALRNGGFDVGLFDYKLGGTTGLEILRKVQAQQCEIPVILLTGSENPEIDQAALDAGAADYLCKSALDTTRLERAIRYSINHAQMLSAVRESQAQLQLFMRSVPCAVCIYDEKGAVLFQNDIFKTHFTVEAVIAARETKTGSGPAQYSHEGHHWLISDFPMVERNGRPLQGIAAIDVTERIETEEALRKTSEFLNGVLNTLPVAVARIDANATVRESRGNALAGLGLRDNELNGTSIYSLFPKATPAINQALGGESVNFLSEVKHGGKTYHFDNYY
ncbi:MAG TPA: response regulator, partial [Opitutaceae bacterium]